MIIAQLSTIPERRHLLPRVVESLAPQVDELHVMCNDYDSNEHPVNIANKYYWATPFENKGDCEKFVELDLYRYSYILTCDDDLVYPQDYVETMVGHVKRFGNKAIISLHGRTFPKRPIDSYYRGKKQGFHWDHDLDIYQRVDAGGTGVMCWHSDAFKVPYDEIAHGNMADVWVSVFARRQGVDIWVAPHESGWLKYIGPPENDDDPQTIWSRHHNDDRLQTDIYNAG